jgi:PAS domain S-box-containing protein
MLISQDLRMFKYNSHEVRDIHVKEHTWAEAFEHLAVSVAQLTLDGRLLSANEQMCVAIGQPEGNLLERNLEEFLLPEESWAGCKAGLNELIAGEVPHYSSNMSATRATGELVWVNMAFSLVRDDVTNKPRSLTAVARDITFLKRAEQELRDAEVLRDDLSRRMMGLAQATALWDHADGPGATARDRPASSAIR